METFVLLKPTRSVPCSPTTSCLEPETPDRLFRARNRPENIYHLERVDLQNVAAGEAIFPENTDVVTGGFPPDRLPGKRRGLLTYDYYGRTIERSEAP